MIQLINQLASLMVEKKKRNHKIGRVNSKEYIVLDIETTGADPIEDEIIEFAAVKIEDNQVIDKTSFYIRPTSKIADEVTQRNGISNEMVCEAINYVDGLKKIKRYISDSTLVAHNGIQFDFNFLNEQFKKHKIKPMNNPMFCTLKFLQKKYINIKSYSLDNLVEHFEIEHKPENNSRALNDCEVVHRILEKTSFKASK